LRDSTEPVVVLIGGATGVGTSTLAADVARRLNIQSVIGTDSIREVLRRAISPDLLPLLHKSSYEIKREDVRVPIEEEETVLFGFRQQASQVAVGVEAIVDRGLKEGTNLVVEGVHLAPEIILNRYRTTRTCARWWCTSPTSTFTARASTSGPLAPRCAVRRRSTSPIFGRYARYTTT
jgi:2-phosphoglycerate kinase